MEGPTSSGGSRNRLTCLTLQEHDDDDRIHVTEVAHGYTRFQQNLPKNPPKWTRTQNVKLAIQGPRSPQKPRPSKSAWQPGLEKHGGDKTTVGIPSPSGNAHTKHKTVLQRV